VARTAELTDGGWIAAEGLPGGLDAPTMCVIGFSLPEFEIVVQKVGPDSF
jgi:hypothetical protein